MADCGGNIAQDSVDKLVAEIGDAGVIIVDMANNKTLTTLPAYKSKQVAEEFYHLLERMNEVRAWHIPVAVIALGQFCEMVLENQDKLGLDKASANRYKEMADKCHATFKPDAIYARSKTNLAYLL